MKASLRLATIEDAPAIYKLLQAMHAERLETKEKGVASFSPRKVAWEIDDLIKDHVVMVAESKGEIVGSVGLRVVAPWYSEDTWFADRWMYVRQDARGSRIAEDMLRKAKKVARRAGFPLGMGVQSTRDTARKNALFRRHMTAIGEMFIAE